MDPIDFSTTSGVLYHALSRVGEEFVAVECAAASRSMSDDVCNPMHMLRVAGCHVQPSTSGILCQGEDHRIRTLREVPKIDGGAKLLSFQLDGSIEEN